MKTKQKINQIDSNGNSIGYLEYYNDNGQLRYKGHYANGKEIRYWVYYWYNGKLKEKKYYT